jgi:hypothetical protein
MKNSFAFFWKFDDACFETNSMNSSAELTLYYDLSFWTGRKSDITFNSYDVLKEIIYIIASTNFSVVKSLVFFGSLPR